MPSRDVTLQVVQVNHREGTDTPGSRVDCETHSIFAGTGIKSISMFILVFTIADCYEWHSIFSLDFSCASVHNHAARTGEWRNMRCQNSESETPETTVAKFGVDDYVGAAISLRMPKFKAIDPWGVPENMSNTFCGVFRLHRLHAVHEMCPICYRCSMVSCVCVSARVGQATGELCKNDWTDSRLGGGAWLSHGSI